MSNNDRERSRERDRNRRSDRPNRMNSDSRERSRDRLDRSKKVADRRIYVSNIPYDFRWQDLKDLFRTEVGKVAHVELFTDENDKPRGCGIVEFEDSESVKVAVEKMHRFDIKGRKLVVKEVWFTYFLISRYKIKIFKFINYSDSCTNFRTMMLSEINMADYQLVVTMIGIGKIVSEINQDSILVDKVCKFRVELELVEEMGETMKTNLVILMVLVLNFWNLLA